MLNYTVYMFRKAGVQLDAFFCAVLVGVARLASTCISACMLDLVGRKTFLVAAALMCAVSEGVAGIFLFLEVEKATWVPLASVIVFVIGYGLGLGSIPGVYVGELLPLLNSWICNNHIYLLSCTLRRKPRVSKDDVISWSWPDAARVWRSKSGHRPVRPALHPRNEGPDAAGHGEGLRAQGGSGRSR